MSYDLTDQAGPKMPTNKCGHCSQVMEEEELDGHLREAWDYAPWSCSVCDVHFHRLSQARFHFDPEFSRHPGSKMSIVEWLDESLELRISELIQSNSETNNSQPEHEVPEDSTTMAHQTTGDDTDMESMNTGSKDELVQAPSIDNLNQKAIPKVKDSQPSQDRTCDAANASTYESSNSRALSLSLMSEKSFSPQKLTDSKQSIETPDISLEITANASRTMQVSEIPTESELAADTNAPFQVKEMTGETESHEQSNNDSYSEHADYTNKTCDVTETSPEKLPTTIQQDGTIDISKQHQDTSIKLSTCPDTSDTSNGSALSNTSTTQMLDSNISMPRNDDLDDDEHDIKNNSELKYEKPSEVEFATKAWPFQDPCLELDASSNLNLPAQGCAFGSRLCDNKRFASHLKAKHDVQITDLRTLPGAYFSSNRSKCEESIQALRTACFGSFRMGSENSVLSRKKPTHQCRECAKTMTYDHINLHLASRHLNKPVFACNYCEFTESYWFPQATKRHLAKSHKLPGSKEHYQDNRKRYKDIMLELRQRLIPHVERQRAPIGERQTTCRLCGTSLVAKALQNMQSHILMHHVSHNKQFHRGQAPQFVDQKERLRPLIIDLLSRAFHIQPSNSPKNNHMMGACVRTVL